MASLYQLGNREVPWMDPKAAFSANGTAPFCQPMPWRYLEPWTQRILESAKPKKNTKTAGNIWHKPLWHHYHDRDMLKQPKPKIEIYYFHHLDFCFLLQLPEVQFLVVARPTATLAVQRLCYKAWGFFRFKNHLHMCDLVSHRESEKVMEKNGSKRFFCKRPYPPKG